MRFVIDTSILVSAAIRDRDRETLLLLIADNPGWLWLASDAIRGEYLEVLARPKFNLPASLLERWKRLVESAAARLGANIEVDFDRDPDDRPFLACAVASGADMLITGDRDLLDLRQIGPTRILTFSAALTELRQPNFDSPYSPRTRIRPESVACLLVLHPRI